MNEKTDKKEQFSLLAKFFVDKQNELLQEYQQYVSDLTKDFLKKAEDLDNEDPENLLDF